MVFKQDCKIAVVTPILMGRPFSMVGTKKHAFPRINYVKQLRVT